MNSLKESMIYGTAWKKDVTARLVVEALKTGFRAVDTAGQPKHYREDLVGDGVREVLKEGTVTRSEIFVGEADYLFSSPHLAQQTA